MDATVGDGCPLTCPAVSYLSVVDALFVGRVPWVAYLDLVRDNDAGTG